MQVTTESSLVDVGGEVTDLNSLMETIVDLATGDDARMLFGDDNDDDADLFEIEHAEAEEAVVLGAFYRLQEAALKTTDSETLVSYNRCKARFDAIERDVEECQSTLNDLRDKYNSVSDKTSAMHQACDQMLSQQTRLAVGTDQLKTYLHYYTQHERIMKKLTTTRLQVTGSVFSQLLANIHECIQFLRAHPQHRESALYIEKYEACLSRALTAIKASVFADVAACDADVRTRRRNHPSGAAFSDEDSYALLYGVFGARAAGTKNALTLAHQFFSEHDEYIDMVTECEEEYFAVRETLLRPAVEATINSLVVQHKDSSHALVRETSNLLLRLCDDEFRLYKQFFIVKGAVPQTPTSASSFWYAATGTAGMTPFHRFTEGLCRTLYDSLRPLVIHNPHLETLAQLCTLLKIEMIEERCGNILTQTQDPDSNDFINPRAGFASVMSELVGDIVERIVYRTSLFGQNDILGYKAAPGDLAYPERLIMMKNIEAETTATPGGAGSSTSAIDLHCLWYPTVRRTIMCLSKLFKCLDQSVFVSISRELFEQCCQSLETAAEAMRAMPIDPAKASVKGFGRQLDAQLFVVKHLLIIREQTSPYRITAKVLRNNPASLTAAGSAVLDSAISHFDYSFDVSRYRNSAMQLFTPESRAKWFELSSNNAFLSFLLSAPVQVHELQTDSRRIIESELRKHCHTLIEFVTSMVVGPLVFVTAEVDASESKSPEAWKTNPKLQPKALNDVVSNIFRNLKQNWPSIRATFSLYIGVRETEEILLQPIRKSVVDTFTTINLFAQKNFTEEQRQVANVPNQEQVWLLLNA